MDKHMVGGTVFLVKETILQPGEMCCWCCLLITFVNSLDLDQAWRVQIV